MRRPFAILLWMALLTITLGGILIWHALESLIWLPIL